MQLRRFLSVLVTAEMASAVSMTYYNPRPGVPPEFRAFLEAYVQGIFCTWCSLLKLTRYLQARGPG